MAKELGADFQLKVTGKVEPKQLAKQVEELLGAQPHVAIECTGAESSIQTAIYVRDEPETKQQQQQHTLIHPLFIPHGEIYTLFFTYT